MGVAKLPRTLELLRDSETLEISLCYIDQQQLPTQLVRVTTSDWRQVTEAIKNLEVRGAPAIGLAGAAAFVLAAQSFIELVKDGFEEELEAASKVIEDARPTAVNLSWAIERMRSVFRLSLKEGKGSKDILNTLFDEVRVMEAEDEVANRRIGENGAALLPYDATVLTHCNAGSLATGYYGTALGVIYTASEQGKIRKVFVDETRPVGQGSRLSAWELSQVGIPATLICDSMAASIMASGEVDAVIVGADRICANGDVVNKIGTYSLAILAKFHKIPFYVAAPQSTVDEQTRQGSQVIIEQRDPLEVTGVKLPGVNVFNPAFDVTPSELVTAIITEVDVYPHSD